MAIAYIRKRLRMKSNPIMFVILCAVAFTFFSLLVSAAGDFRMHAKTIEDPKAMVVIGIVIFACSIPAAWFIRFSAVAGSWSAFERIEGAYKKGLKREAWQMLMSRYRIHRVVIQSQRFRQFLCDMCDYVISVDALNDNQKTLLRNLLAAAGDPSIRGICRRRNGASGLCCWPLLLFWLGFLSLLSNCLREDGRNVAGRCRPWLVIYSSKQWCE